MISNYLHFLKSVCFKAFNFYLFIYFYTVISLTNNPKNLETRGRI